MTPKRHCLRSRNRLLAGADVLFKRADGRIQLVEADFSEELLREAADMFASAGASFHELGLGLRARDCWARAAQCHRDLAAEQSRIARQFDEMRDQVPVLWGPGSEGEADE
jgi:hypothetical protein